MDTPVTSGSDLISNPGNANLGYSSGVGYATNPAVADPFSGINDTLSRIQQQDAQMRMQRHLEQRQDLDNLNKMLSETGGSLFNMKDANGNNNSFVPLPEDKKILDDKTRTLHRLMLNNPEHYQTIPEFNDQYRELKLLTRQAGVRSAFHTSEGLEAAKEADPEEQAKRIENREKNISTPLADYAPVNPYMPNPKVDPLAFFPKGVLTDKDADTTYKVSFPQSDGTTLEKDMVGKKDNVVDFRERARVSTQLNAQAKIYAAGLLRELGQNPQKAVDLINSADKFNQDRGYTPDNPHYLHHVVDVLPNGQIKLNINDPVELSYALLGPSIGALSPNLKPSDANIKQRAEEADIEDKKGRLALANKEYELKKDKQSQDALDKAQNGLDASVAAKQVSDAFNGSLNQSKLHNLPVSEWLKGYNPAIAKNAKGQAMGELPHLEEALTGRGLDPANHIFTKVNKGDLNVQEMLGEKETPKEAYFIHDTKKKGEDMLVALMPEFKKMKKQGVGDVMEEQPPHWVFVSKKDAIANKISSLSKKAKSIKVANAINEAQGGESGNEATPKESPKTKVIGRATYQLENGEWFKI